MDPRVWFEEWLDALNRHDLAALAALMDPGVRRAHLPRGADAWLNDLRERFDAFPDLQSKRIALVVEDDRLAAHLRTRGTQRGAYRGVAATGQRVNLAEYAFLRLAGDRVVESAGTGDDDLVAALSAGRAP